MAKKESDPVSLQANPRRATQVDARLGQMIRDRRLAIGLSQADLADAIQVTPHQLIKYERGDNRISASRLVECAKLLGVPVSWFFSWTQNAAAVDVPDQEKQLIDVFKALTPAAQVQLIAIARLLRGDAT
jgi:transcriptional regulator with XRE-family HTH domain